MLFFTLVASERVFIKFFTGRSDQAQKILNLHQHAWSEKKTKHANFSKQDKIFKKIMY